MLYNRDSNHQGCNVDGRKYITIAELAALLGKSEPSAWRFARDAKLTRYHKIGERRTYFDAEAVTVAMAAFVTATPASE